MGEESILKIWMKMMRRDKGIKKLREKWSYKEMLEKQKID